MSERLRKPIAILNQTMMEVDELNLTLLRSYSLSVVQGIAESANLVVSKMEDMDSELCRLEEKLNRKSSNRGKSGFLVKGGIRADICNGCRQGQYAADRISLGHLIGYTMECARRLADYAEQAEEESNAGTDNCTESAVSSN